MISEVKDTWEELKDAEPGTRFQRYNRTHQAKHRSKAGRIATTAVGVILVAVGLVALPAPGPGTLVIIIGAALIARESAWLARTLDWLEVRLRKVWHWIARIWERAPLAGKVALCLAGVGIAGAAMVVLYKVTFRA